MTGRISAAQHELTQALKAEARRLGFTLVGVTPPDPPPHLNVFQDWLQQGRHGSMSYLETERSLERRSDPRRILPECQSILVLAVPYDPSPMPEPGQAAARVAAYALGQDYHEVLPGRLQALVDFLEARLGHAVPNRYYTDTGPLLERDLAQRAGLGWIGKNTCLINPGQGSYFLLAEILLGVALTPDTPFTADHCGTCTRCLEACPTACILPDRTLDARRCLSYLTIELKGAIPSELRSTLGEWVFGCDICQQVCPWNIRFAPAHGDPAFVSGPGASAPDPLAALYMTPQEFSAHFKGSPVKRARRRGYLRNAAVVLGNRRDPSAIAVLHQALLADPEPLVRAHAAWALGHIGGPSARNALLEAATRETETSVAQEIAAALESAQTEFSSGSSAI